MIFTNANIKTSEQIQLMDEINKQSLVNHNTVAYLVEYTHESGLTIDDNFKRWRKQRYGE